MAEHKNGSKPKATDDEFAGREQGEWGLVEWIRSVRRWWAEAEPKTDGIPDIVFIRVGIVVSVVLAVLVAAAIVYAMRRPY